MDPTKTNFPRLSSSSTKLKPHYDVVVVGSGYGGSIAACRAASAGKTVCLLEKGKEWLPGEFPETLMDTQWDVQMHFGARKFRTGKPYGLHEVYWGENVSVVQGCGLGGGSLVNANVGLDAEPAVYQKPDWPVAFTSDLQNMLKTDHEHVIDMLKPTPYPDSYPPLAKMERMREGFDAFDIEDLHKHFYKTPLYVTFEDKKENHVGVPQPKCTSCGNCCGGCNVGAKNTLNMNYIAEAKAFGAEIYTKIEVMSVARELNSNGWLVHYKRLVNGRFDIPEATIHARHVILGAGALGSTKILFRSKERGLNISPTIGTKFSTNGDMLAFSYDGAKKTNSTPRKDVAPGPCITTVMDMRSRNGKVEDSFVIEDGTAPSSVAQVYSIGLTLAGKGVDITQKSIDKSLIFLGMSHDNAHGKITYHTETDDVSVSYKDVGYEPNFTMVNEAASKVAEKLGGMFMTNLLWSECLGKSVVTVHPLGGCPMAESGQTGVVNHAGQVFEGDSNEILEGLYVVDGAIIPTSVGVNPTLTISCVAERCMRLLAEREGWHIDYEFKLLGENAFVQPKPGLCFTEKMVGKFNGDGSEFKDSSCEFTVTIESKDVRTMLDLDPDHAAGISGTVTCPSLSSSPLTISKGRFQLFSSAKNDKPNSPSKQMVYRMVLNSVENTTFSFHGVKRIHKNHFWQIGLRDTTLLFVKIYKGSHFYGNVLGTAKLYITVPNFATQLESLEVTNAESVRERMYWIARFGTFFSKTLWDVYGPGVRAHSSNFDDEDDEVPRQRRAMKVGICIPFVYELETKDGFQITVTRYQGGTKGPVAMYHGAAMSSEMFALDTIETNLLEYVFKEGYDVWLVDYRLSSRFPLSQVQRDYTMDDIANYDHPAAIDKILEVTKKKSVQVVAHCVGSMSMFSSLLAGNLEGKVRNLIVTSVGMNPETSTFVGKLKGAIPYPLRIARISNALGINGLTSEAREQSPFLSRMLNIALGVVSDNAVIPDNERCNNPVCHRTAFIYGLLWKHKNLSEQTHRNMHEYFGHVTIILLAQLGSSIAAKKLVSSTGEDIYLPDSDKGLKSEVYKKHISRLDLPIRFIVGEHNQVFLPECTLATLNLLKEAHPKQNYQRFVISDYGHLDTIIGKNAVQDVYPRILESLEQYADGD